MTTSAKVIADSVSPDGVRLTTMEVTLHRFVLAELNTHRVFSRNSASSRAIPVEKMVERARNDAAWPISWPAEKPGMQGGEALTGVDLQVAQELFHDCRNLVLREIDSYLNRTSASVRLHKSVINRLLEPFLWHTVIVTSTEWDNFFALRCHPMAQPEIRAAAELMQAAYVSSTPSKLQYGEWHAPYADDLNEAGDFEGTLKSSAARCAWVSTASHDGDHSWDAVERMYQRLSTADPMHASPFEHQATPCDDPWEWGNFRGWKQLRRYLENGEEPWTMPEFDAPTEGLLDGIEPLRAGREGDTQPLPVASGSPISHHLVADDLAARLELGVKRYGQPLQPFNGRDSLRDAYEEILDLAVYLRTLIYEQEHPDG